MFNFQGKFDGRVEGIEAYYPGPKYGLELILDIQSIFDIFYLWALQKTCKTHKHTNYIFISIDTFIFK